MQSIGTRDDSQSKFVPIAPGTSVRVPPKEPFQSAQRFHPLQHQRPVLVILLMRGTVVASTVKSITTKQSLETEQVSGAVISDSVATEANILTQNGETTTASSIQNAWRRKASASQSLDTKNLIDRLHLEAGLLKGAVRLVLFTAIFVLLMAFSSVGVPSSAELSVSTVLKQSLELSSFQEIETLDALKVFLPQLSSSIKAFSASSSMRFPDDDSIQLLGQRHVFLAPRVLQGLDLPIDGTSFSISAWVEVTDPDTKSTLSVLRKPFTPTSQRSCWAWSTPGELRFGAHDFHTLQDSNPGEEVASISAAVSGELAHEALVIADNIATFYRNGQVLGQVVLPRVLTDCSDKELELGSAGLALTSVKFYARALQANEIDEIFSGGQPLSELATGSVLPQYEHDSIQQVEALVQAESHDIQELLISKAKADHVTAAISLSKAESIMEDWPPPFTSDDPAPPAVAPGGDGVRTLPAEQRRKWEAGPRLINVSAAVANEWREDETLGQYWSVLDNPVYTSGEPTWTPGVFPELPPGTTTATVSFWHRALHTRINYGISLEFSFPGARAWSPFLRLHSEGFFSQTTLHNNSKQHVHAEEHGARWDDDLKELDARFVYGVLFHTGQPGPICWRHVAYEINYETKTLSSFMDGRLLMEARWGPDHGGVEMPPLNDFLASSQLNFKWIWGFAYPAVKHGGIVADVRVYPRGLSAEEHLHLQDGVWSGGAPQKQCVEFANDWQVFDSTLIDDENHDCSWYNEQMLTTPQVCQTTKAQQMCPVTCSAHRECHDGSWYAGYTKPKVNKYRVFDRIMHLKPPSDQSTSVICPSNTVDVAQVLEECRSGEHPPRHPNHYQYKHERVVNNWDGHGKTDIADCDKLELVLDAAQCGWDGSWLPAFQAEVKEVGSWSMSFWAHPTAGSKGMPEGFFYSFHFFRQLVAPFSLVDFFTQDPKSQSWATVTVPGDSRWSAEAHVYPLGCCTKPATTWTFFYAQLEKMSDTRYRFSAAINGIPLGIWSGEVDVGADGSPAFLDESFLQAFEVTSEMLITPIEFSAALRGPAEVQQLYYQQRRRLLPLTGSRFSELQRVSSRDRHFEKQQGKFDAAMLLVAPPLLFQTRQEAAECVSPVLGAQFDLIQAVHCPPGACPSLDRPESVFTCVGDATSTERYFGREATELGGSEGFSDFLYTLADNPVVVRDGQELPTEAFLDGRTASLSVLALLQSPSTGLLTMLDLDADIGDGGLLEASVDISHFGGLDASARRQCVGYLVAFLLCIAALALLNLSVLVGHVRNGRRHGEYKTVELAEAAGDLGVAVLLIIFAAVWLPFLLNSEDRARDLEVQLASVPFASATVPFDDKITSFFLAVDDLTATLQTKANLESFGFAMLILMLLRVLAATSAHPRIGLLTGTVRHALNDFYHFALLFVLLFYLFSLSATWCFGHEDPAFADLKVSMKTQFEMLLGSLPEGFETDNKMIVYVTLTNVVMFFLMLNFLLAIVVEGYMAVRGDIEENEVANGVLTDLCLTLRNYARCWFFRWPWPSELEDLLRRSVASKSVSADDLHTIGLPPSVASSLLSSYAEQDPLLCKPSATRLDPAPSPPEPDAAVSVLPPASGAALATDGKMDTAGGAPFEAAHAQAPRRWSRDAVLADAGPLRLAKAPSGGTAGSASGSQAWMRGELAMPRTTGSAGSDGA